MTSLQPKRKGIALIRLWKFSHIVLFVFCCAACLSSQLFLFKVFGVLVPNFLRTLKGVIGGVGKLWGGSLSVDRASGWLTPFDAAAALRTCGHQCGTGRQGQTFVRFIKITILCISFNRPVLIIIIKSLITAVHLQH